jgi:hypothetical protein
MTYEYYWYTPANILNRVNLEHKISQDWCSDSNRWSTCSTETAKLYKMFTEVGSGWVTLTKSQAMLMIL